MPEVAAAANSSSAESAAALPCRAVQSLVAECVEVSGTRTITKCDESFTEKVPRSRIAELSQTNNGSEGGDLSPFDLGEQDRSIDLYEILTNGT